MAKNRFNTRASWDTNFKYSGQLSPSSLSPKKQPLSSDQLNRLSEFKAQFNDKMNDWERDFIKNIIVNGVKTSPKQKEILKKIFIKVHE
jgi:hypothetical protein